MDVARSLVLPDRSLLSLRSVLTLALYWDEFYLIEPQGEVPQWEERASSVCDRLIGEGLLKVVPVKRSPLIPKADQADSETDTISMLRLGKDEVGKSVFQESVELPSELVENAKREPFFDGDMSDALGELLARGLIRDIGHALDIAVANALVPLAMTQIGQLACAIGSEDEEADISTAALMSASIEAFELDESVSVEEILRFRENNRVQLQRFRASISDLAGSVGRSQSMPTALASARDTYLSRVEPALASLESALDESFLKFATKSLFGLARLTTSPVEPVGASMRAATLAANAINYRFSRKTLVEEHPWAYAHLLTSQLGKNSPVSGGPLIDPVALADPKSAIVDWGRKRMVELLAGPGD